MGVDLSYLNEDSTHAADGADTYNATPDSNPWGEGGAPTGSVATYGQMVESGFYDGRDDMVGGTDTRWNQGDGQVSGANWASAGDNAPTANSASGLDGERTKFSGVMSQGSLADNADPSGFSPV